MNQIVASSAAELNFIFHCTDGDLYTYNHVIANMTIIKRDIETKTITNSFVVPFDKRTVAAAITLQEIGLKDLFYESVGSYNNIDKKILKGIIAFYQLVGNNDKNHRYFNGINCLISDNLKKLITTDIMDMELSYPYDEMTELFSFYKRQSTQSFMNLTFQDKLEFLDLDDTPELIQTLSKVRESKEYQKELQLAADGILPMP